MRQAFDADVTAIRIFEAGDFTQHDCYVDAAPLGLSHEQDATFQAWPARPGSLFDQIHAVPRYEGVRRLQELVRPPGVQAGLFAELGQGVDVRDCLVLEFTIIEPLWAAVAVLRCGPSPVFTLHDLRALDQVKPALTHLLRVSCQRQGIGPGKAQGTHQPGQPLGLSAEQLIARLTRMECQVLHYLRLGCTERQISQEIHRSQHTIHVHVKNIYRKLNISSRRQLIETFNGADPA